MILTEEEAKTKWCQAARMLPNAPGYGAGNRFAEATPPSFDHETRCIGSACMAWRWFEGIELGSGRVVTHAERNGYCGKAGKP